MPFRNRLLSALPPDEMSVVAPSLERVALDAGRVLIDVERPIDAVWFPEDAVISQLSVMADRSAVALMRLSPPPPSSRPRPAW